MTDLLILSESDMMGCLEDVEAVLSAVEDGVRAYASGQARAFPTVSMQGNEAGGGIYTIRGILDATGQASVKTVGSFPGNRALGLPPDPGILTLIDVSTGVPSLVASASHLTTIRTAAVTAIGAAKLARPGARTIGCIGARGIAPVAARMIAGQIEGLAIKVHSRSEATRADCVARMRAAGLDAHEVSRWDDCVAGSDVVIDGAGLAEDAPYLKGNLIAPGALVISYGANCSFDDDVLPGMDRIIVDRWDAAPSGALGRLIATGAMSEARIDAYFGDVVLKKAKGRDREADRVLFWHRGLGACDITLAEMARDAALKRSLGIRVKFQ